MKNIAIIPARSGSKGLPDKNIKMLAGKPLLAYAILAAIKCDLFDEIMVSTDSEAYAEIAKVYGANIPFLREKETSSDSAGSWDVVNEVLHGYLRSGRKFDTVCLLQPTSPLRNAEDITGGYKLLEEKKADAVTAVCEVEHSPLWMMTLATDCSLASFRKGMKFVPRQNLDQYYRLNGALYIRRILYGQNNIQLLDEREYAYIMERKRSVDIDTIDDFEYARFLIETNTQKEG